MAADQDAWKSFIKWCEEEIEERQVSLAPLTSGSMHTGRRGPETGYVWIDTTTADALRIRNEIASLKSVIARSRHHVE